jgi:hypothetical protein
MPKSNPPEDLELHPVAWSRSKRAAGVVAKTPPHSEEEKESYQDKEAEAGLRASASLLHQRRDDRCNCPKTIRYIEVDAYSDTSSHC